MNDQLRLAGHLGLSSPERPLLAHLGRSPGSIDQIDALADHGFAGVQDLFLKLRAPAEQAQMAARMADRGLSLSSFGGDPAYWNTPLWSSADLSAIRASVQASAALARQFGGAGVVCVAGFDLDRSSAMQIRAMIENLKQVADCAADANLTLLVEPIAPQRIPAMLLDRLEAGVDVVRAVNMPSVRLMFDIAHVAMMGHDVPTALEACADVVGRMQVADVRVHERVDPGLGTLDWPAIGNALVRIDYRGVTELEYEPVEPTADMEAAMAARFNAIVEGQAPRL